MFEKLKKFFNKKFKKHTTVGELEQKAWTMEKCDLVRRIINLAGMINGHESDIPAGFQDKLLKKPKRLLVRTFLLMSRAYTIKLQGQ